MHNFVLSYIFLSISLVNICGFVIYDVDFSKEYTCISIVVYMYIFVNALNVLYFISLHAGCTCIILDFVFYRAIIITECMYIF